MLDAELNRYTYIFWNDYDNHHIYQSEAVRLGWTADAGLSDKLKAEIADKHKKELLDGYLKPVFIQLEERARQEQYDDYYREFDEMRAMFNQMVTLLNGRFSSKSIDRLRLAEIQNFTNQ